MCQRIAVIIRILLPVKNLVPNRLGFPARIKGQAFRQGIPERKRLFGFTVRIPSRKSIAGTYRISRTHSLSARQNVGGFHGSAPTGIVCDPGSRLYYGVKVKVRPFNRPAALRGGAAGGIGPSHQRHIRPGLCKGHVGRVNGRAV